MPYIAPKSNHSRNNPSIDASRSALQSSQSPALCIEPTSYISTSPSVKQHVSSNNTTTNNNNNSSSSSHAFTFPPPPPSTHLPSKIHRPSSRSSSASLCAMANGPTTPLAPSLLPLYKPKKSHSPASSLKSASSCSDMTTFVEKKPLSAQFLSKQPRGYPQRSPPLSPTSPSSSASLTASPSFSTDESSSSEASSTSSSTSSSSLSLDNDPILFSKLTQAVQAMALAQSYHNVAMEKRAQDASAAPFVDSETSTPPNASCVSLPTKEKEEVKVAEPAATTTTTSTITSTDSTTTTTNTTSTTSPPVNIDSTTSLCTLTPSTPVHSSPTIPTLAQNNTTTSTAAPLQLPSSSSTTTTPLATSPPPPPLHINLPTSPSQVIIRKKSGERVKSSLKLPSLVRPCSMPNTPSKMVHFDTNLVHVRHFLNSEKPTAVSADSSPSDERAKFHLRAPDSESESDSESEIEEDPRVGFQRFLSRSEWKISLPNFPHVSLDDMSTKNVCLESIFLSSDKESLVGHIAVRNMAYQKYVCIRYTTDYWKTFTEVQADYNDDVRRKKRLPGFDKFTFAIKLANIPYNTLTSKSMYLCVRYATAGQEFWDNNNSYNYQVDFTRVSKSSGGSLSRRSSSSGPRHRRSKSYSGSFNSRDGSDFSHTSNPQELRLDSDFNHDFDALSSSISSVDDILDDLAPKLKNNADNQRSNFTSRYSFGASLNATRKKTDDNNINTTTNKDTQKNANNNNNNTTPSSNTPFAFNSQFALRREESSSDSDDEEYAHLPSLAQNKSKVTTPSSTGARRSPASFSTHKLALNAGSYQELIKNYCFFQGPKSASSSGSSTRGSGSETEGTTVTAGSSVQSKSQPQPQPQQQQQQQQKQTNGPSAMVAHSVREWPQELSV
ncbi:uncharacterized protein SAPINGB_P006093 [Magnusiomyces paraingens]|uniref:CBM21 domain-containing protein n=1 Tax=Magnusiomyces paraingens TaxID=2606893 RepID=A0A5E8C4D9_9ASCO|nr:uncharacterized protein SAPINGB_P006093 [Saprochaete ingens]VVT58212.1 unnamed protein product [Saprochaete ingens]